MRTFILSLFAAVFFLPPTVVVSATPPSEFRFFVQRDPVTLHPLKSIAAGSSHVLNNIFRGLYRFEDDKGFVSELATCRYATSSEIRCKIKPNLKYSGGDEILIEDFLRPFYLGFMPGAQPMITAELTGIKNAKEIIEKKKDVSTLGVRKISESEFSITLNSPDRDFIFRLMWPSFSPLPADINDDIVLARDYATGPYRLRSWERGRNITLDPNPNYHGGAPQVSAKALVVSDETTALKLFQTGQLDFLRRVPTEHFQEVKKLPGFYQNALLRMDYLGFGGDLINRPNLRLAMALALDYEEFRRAFFALGRPGCFGLSKDLAGEPVCYSFDLKKAKELLAKEDPKFIQTKKLKLFVADQGGDHVLRTGQWFQAQWKKNLGINVEIEVQEMGVLSERLRKSPPDIFRRGMGLDRPTCVAALESFTTGNPDNFLRLDRPKVMQIVEDLKSKELSAVGRRGLCHEALKNLLDSNRFIPLGEMHFITLTSKSFAGIRLNALHQLDLSGLRRP